MLYVLAIFVPPLACLAAGKGAQAILNVALWSCFLIPGIIHGLIVVSQAEAERRQREMLDAIRRRP